MKKRLLFILFLMQLQCSFAQVDVVYSNLVWSDEFNTTGPLNTGNWFQQTQLPAGGSWFNSEVQHYTNQASNAFVDGGNLNIVAKREDYTDQGITKQYTSARLNSKFAFKYGRVDVRAKIPMEAGTWPAIWMLGKNVNEPGGFFSANYGTTDWPACGETDIMEHGIFQAQPANYIQSTLHTPSSHGNSINNGGILASDLANSFHVYSLNWSPFQMSFLLDGVVFYTYNPAEKTPDTWPFDKEQFILLNIAMGGVAGSIDPNFTQTTMLIDYVRVYQNTLVDTVGPTQFTAALGTVTGTTVELLLNATDNSGALAYTVTYNGITYTTAGTSGVQKSIVIPNLTPNTTYQFTITAADLSGNAAANNPIILTANTPASIQCTGTSTQAQQGNFSLGYNYTFQTIGTDVKITFELLDINRVGLVAYLWKQSPFSEAQMTNVSGNIFTKTISGLANGTVISYAVKFAYAGGLSVTNYVNYTVGTNCSLGGDQQTKLSQYFYPNPVDNVLNLQLADDQNHVTLTDIVGKMVMEGIEPESYSIDMTNKEAGVYFLRVSNSTGSQVVKIVKK